MGSEGRASPQRVHKLAIGWGRHGECSQSGPCPSPHRASSVLWRWPALLPPLLFTYRIFSMRQPEETLDLAASLLWILQSLSNALGTRP